MAICLPLLLVAGGCSHPAAASRPAELIVPAGTVVVYTRSGCPYCRQAREFLVRSGVPFVERNVERDPAAREELLVLYRQRLPGARVIVPLVVNGDQAVSGFDEEELAELLRHDPLAKGPPAPR